MGPFITEPINIMPSGWCLDAESGFGDLQKTEDLIKLTSPPNKVIRSKRRPRELSPTPR
jgi:hypothetical protein